MLGVLDLDFKDGIIASVSIFMTQIMAIQFCNLVQLHKSISVVTLQSDFIYFTTGVIKIHVLIIWTVRKCVSKNDLVYILVLAVLWIHETDSPAQAQLSKTALLKVLVHN